MEIPYKPADKFARGPKKKVPFIVIDGKPLGDSHLIIDALEKRVAAEGKRPLDEGLSARDRAIAHCVRRMLEEGYYFVGLYARWGADEGYAEVRQEFKKFVPGFIIPFIRRDSVKKLYYQGTGRHTHDEIMELGAADFDAIAELLGDRPYLLGDTIRTVDCTVYGFLEGLLGFPVETPIKKRVAAHANLVAYRQRIRDRYWKDLPVS